MEPAPQNPVSLEHARIGWRDRRPAKLISKMPLWLIALLLLLPIWILDHFNFSSYSEIIEHIFNRYSLHFFYCATLFLPGSIKRLNWRQALIVLPFSAVFCGLGLEWSSLKGASEIPLLFGVGPIIAILGATLSEHLFLPKRNGKSISWAVGLALAAGCTVALIDSFLNFTGRTSSFQVLQIGGWYEASWAYLLYAPLLGIAAWISIPLGQELPLMKTRTLRLTIGATAVLIVAIYALFFQVWMYSLAIDALRGSGPFSKGMAVAILQGRNDPSIRQEFWNALETADWSKPESYTGGNEYRKYCINILAARDPGGTAGRLAEMLRKNPSKILARFSAKLLADEIRYDTVPILVRYALLDEDACIDALESMHLPVAATAILRHAAVWHAIGFGPNVKDFPLDTSVRSRLISVVGKDAGPNFLDWARYCDQVADVLPTPLSAAQTTETHRVVAAFVSYWNAYQTLEDAADRLFIKLLADDGHANVTEQLRAMSKLSTGSRPVTEADVMAAGLNPMVVGTAQNYLDRARKDLAVTPPNWDAPDTAALEDEVQRYVTRVNAMTAKYRLPPDSSAVPL